MVLNSKIKKYLKQTKWYHATTLFNWHKLCFNKVKVNHNVGNELGFGYGFYLTPQQNKAEEYIKGVLKFKVNFIFGEVPVKDYKLKNTPINIEFEFFPFKWYQLNKYNFKILNAYDDEFANFVFHNRVNNTDGTQQHNYDIVFGVMSDNKPMLLIQKYKRGGY